MKHQFYYLEIGDNWHGKCGGVMFEFVDDLFQNLIELVDLYTKNYGGSINGWPLLVPFEDGGIIHHNGAWIHFSSVYMYHSSNKAEV